MFRLPMLASTRLLSCKPPQAWLVSLVRIVPSAYEYTGNGSIPVDLLGSSAFTPVSKDLTGNIEVRECQINQV